MEPVLEGFKMLPAPMMYMAIGIIAFAVIAIVFQLVRGGKKTAKIIKGEKYRKNPKGSMLTQEQQTALCVGAVNGEQTMYYIDSLETGDSIGEVAQNLSKYYGIGRGMGMESADRVLSGMLERGHRYYYDAMKEAFANSEKNAWMQFAKEQFKKEELERCISFMNNLEDCLPLLIEKGYLKDRRDLLTTSIVAWDMGRLVNITRGCLECKYIKEQDAWQFISEALNKSRSSYKTWAEFAAGYVIGRAMWGGHNLSLNGIMDIVQGLLQDGNSPWRKEL